MITIKLPQTTTITIEIDGKVYELFPSDATKQILVYCQDGVKVTEESGEGTWLTLK